MAPPLTLTATQIREKRADNPKLRERVFEDRLGITDARFLSAFQGHCVTPVNSHPDQIMHAAQTMGDVMALTRNVSCVHEKIGVYDNYHPGHHAAMVLSEDIDLRIFPSHWCHGFMVEKETAAGVIL